MPKYLLKAHYTPAGIAGIRKAGGSSRTKAISDLCLSVGGKLESFYFAFGDVDAYVVCDFPSNTVAAGVALTVAAAGGATVETIHLLTDKEVDKAVKAKVAYRAPGS